MQFGAFHGQMFKWVLENALGYTAWLADSMRNETVTSSALSQNKASFKAYAELFPECREVIAKKRQERLNKAKDQEQTSTTATPASRPSTTGRATGTVRSSTAAAVAPLLCRNASPHQISAAISRSLASRKGSSTPNIPASRTPAASTTQVPAVRNATPAVMSISPSQSPESNDEELCSIADKVEHELGIYNIKHDILLNC